MTRISVITGSRADYGLLFWLMRVIDEHPELELQVAVTGSHLSPAHGSTISEIESDGFPIAARVECLVGGDTPTSTSKSVGLASIGFADALASLSPAAVVVLGDRFEILAAALAAYLARIPIAHLCGGDVTAGALDEAMRHMITKMATFHFVSHAEAARRVRQLGEAPDRIFDVGHPGLEWIRRLDPIRREDLEADLGFELRTRNVLVTFHPATLEDADPVEQFRALTTALDELGPGVGVVLTGPNADPGGAALSDAARAWAAERAHAAYAENLGQRRYLSLMREVDVVLGNSSSGILEAPSIPVPTVNVGNRQTGRPRAASIIDCAPRADEIAAALGRAFELDLSGVENPYGTGDTADRTVEILARRLATLGKAPQKTFYDIEPRESGPPDG